MLTRIKHLCKSKGIKLSDLEQQFGFGVNTIIRWDKNKPSIEKVVAVADFFDVSIDYLCDRTEIKQTTNALFEMLDKNHKNQCKISDSDYQIINAYHNAPDRIRTAIQLILNIM